MTQADFAAAVEVSRGYLAGVETGRTKPGRELLARIHKEFGTSIDWMLHGAGETSTMVASTDAEVQLLQAYRRMSEPLAQALLNHALALAKRDAS